MVSTVLAMFALREDQASGVDREFLPTASNARVKGAQALKREALDLDPGLDLCRIEFALHKRSEATHEAIVAVEREISSREQQNVVTSACGAGLS